MNPLAKLYHGLPQLKFLLIRRRRMLSAEFHGFFIRLLIRENPLRFARSAF